MNGSRMSLLRAVTRKPLGLLAAGWLGIVTVAALGAPLIAPDSPDDQDLAHVLSGPTAHHWLGTGALGRDVLSRILYGGRATLLGVLIACVLYVLFGVPLGLVAGYLGGLAERFVLRLADVAYAVPVIIVLLVVVAIFPSDETAAMVVLGLLGAPGLARIVRSVVAAERRELFIKAARVSGLTAFTIMRRHLLPRLAGTVVVQLSIFAAGAVLLETGLGFLGIGNDKASWGQLIAEASQNLGTQPWLLVPSGIVVVTFILALGLLGDAVRDALAEQHGDTSASSAARRVGRGASQGHVPEPAPTASEDGAPGALLSVRDLSVTFATGGTDVTVVSGVGFDVHPGQTLGILGESGCGKSVTASAILGLLPPGGRVSGRVTLGGRDLLAASRDELRAVRGGRVGWISQEPINSLDPSFTVGSQLVEAIRAHLRCSHRAARARALGLLRLVRLPEPERLVRRYPHQLSGGMAQRVGIAAAMAAEPELLIADEPTTALDVTVQAEILDLLRELRQAGTAIMLITHDWGVVSDICDSAVVMYAGQVVEHAAVRDIVHRPRHPYTAALLAADPHHARPGAALPVIEGSVPDPTEWPAGCRFADRCPLVHPDCEQAPVPLRILDDARHTTRCRRHQLVRATSSLPEATAR